jgi:sugar/nucleoside kinase (ribokinase family)
MSAPKANDGGAFETALPGYVDILVVNAIEAEMLGSAPVNSLADAEEAAEHLTSRFGAVVVTVGGDGVAFRTRLTQKSPFLAFRSKWKAPMAQEICSWERSLQG